MKLSLIKFYVLFVLYFPTAILFSCSKSALKPDSDPDSDINNYEIIQIGDQWWMAENLRATKYNDGAPIKNITDNTEWANSSSAAYCYYNNDETKKMPNGVLYNWYVIDPATNGGKNVCPKGWHVPTFSEWYTLQNFVDPTVTSMNIGIDGTDFGKKIKSKTGWSGSGNGTDEFKFNGLPTGYRIYDGSFSAAGDITYHWSVSLCGNCMPDIGGGITSALYFDTSGTWDIPLKPTNGLCIRCLKD